MRNIETLIAEAIEYRSNKVPGTRVYPIEFQQEVVATCDSGAMTKRDFSLRIGCHHSTVSGWAVKLSGGITTRSIDYGKHGNRYAVSTKIEVAEQVLSGIPMTTVSRKMGISTMSVSKWVQDYQDGLFVLENVTQISRKKFKTTEVLLKELDDLQSSIEIKKEEIKGALKKEYEDKLALVS